MPLENTTLEIIASNVDEAIANGLEQLGLTADLVDIEVLDSGARGLLGIGGRQSRVRLTVKQAEPKAKVKAKEKVQTPVDAAFEPEDLDEIKPERTVDPSTLSDDDKQNLKVSKKVVKELLDRMRIKAVFEPQYMEPEDDKEERVILIDIQGDDLSILIGRRSETLNALQYIANLIISKDLGKWVPVLIDVQGYRSRRERQLRQLGRKMAEQAIQTGRKQLLEPMPANERRLIHLELRDHPQVMTESEGEEPFRKVTISLKAQ